LVDSVESMMIHGITNTKFEKFKSYGKLSFVFWVIIVLLFSVYSSILVYPEDKGTTTLRSVGEYPPRRLEPSPKPL